MMSERTFCKIVKQIRNLASIDNDLVNALGISENKIDGIITMLSQAIEEDTTAAWDDYLFDELYNNEVDPKALYDHVLKYLKENDVNNKPTLGECIDNIFSHNSLVSINVEMKDNDGEPSYLHQVFRGMAHDIPEDLLNRKFVSIHSVVSDRAYDDRIFVEIK